MLRRDGEMEQFRLGRHLPFRAGATIDVEPMGTTFVTSDIIDHMPPTGGAFLGFAGGEMAQVFVFAPVTDESPTFLLVESWSATNPDRRHVLRARALHRLAPAPPGGLDGADAAALGDVWPVLTGRLPMDIAVQGYDWSDCGSGPVVVGGHDDRFRYAWIDAADNRSAWSPVYVHAPLVPGWTPAEPAPEVEASPP
jgi:hypothetical protein